MVVPTASIWAILQEKREELVQMIGWTFGRQIAVVTMLGRLGGMLGNDGIGELTPRTLDGQLTVVTQWEKLGEKNIEEKEQVEVQLDFVVETGQHE